MNDAPGGAPRPPRPALSTPEAGVRGPRPPQPLLQPSVTIAGSPGSSPIAAVRQGQQMILTNISASGSRLHSNAGTLRVVGNNLTGGQTKLVLTVDQSNSQIQNWTTPTSVLTPRRTIAASPTATQSPAITASSSILKPTFITPTSVVTTKRLPAPNVVTPTQQTPPSVPVTPMMDSTNISVTMSPTTSPVTTATSPTNNARKRLRMEGDDEDEQLPAKRIKLCKAKKLNLVRISRIHEFLNQERCLMEAKGNLMDFFAYRKRPGGMGLSYQKHLNEKRLDDDSELDRLGLRGNREAGPGVTSLALSKPTLSMSSDQITLLSSSPGSPSIGGLTSPTIKTAVIPAAVKQTPVRSPLIPPVRQHTRQHSISAVYDNSLGSQEQIVEKAKQEAYVMQRVSELQREGLWAEKRLPKVQEPARSKAHWDYLLEEMVWLATDFAQERKWKKAAAKKCARMVQKYFQDKAVQAQKAERNQEQRLKKIASTIAKDVRSFWSNAQKVVEYKRNKLLDERRKKALNQRLNYIVVETEKYSSWIVEGMGSTGHSRPESTANSMIQSASTSSPDRKSHSDGEFEPNQSSSDDEDTIAQAEAEDNKDEQSEEIKMLEKESTMELDDIIKSLPPELREAVQRGEGAKIKTEEGEPKVDDQDEDFSASDEDSSDDEETIQEQEKAEKNVDHKQELNDLEEENNLTVEQLLAKYGRPGEAPPSPVEIKEEEETMVEEDNEESDEEDEGSAIDEDSESEEEEEDLVEDTDSKDVGLSSLLEDMKGITDMDKLANSVKEYQEYQPTGYTLSSTKVETKVPFLLKHELREYQHVGLEWLVTMYNKRLNGILADEMGLGKTIQTIALLAHLACDKSIWGPHLIVVPTSVMLNWEMEFKKWCPAFKILTYYGSQKERKAKRIGWTKQNAFHVCITSYKLVLQDHQSFRRKKWRYLILDEAQNIKNFRSQRWQLLMNFKSQRRLLLTGTPLQNNLMELWSLMHFLMPDVFQSHKEFREWFVNPVTGMIEGDSEYNDAIIKRLHKVLRPFLLRRLKCEVERQLPKKYEHVVMCRLSKRQRYLYDDFMSRAKTKETLAAGNLLSVINVLMQLRKVCNHPNLFEVRPTISPFQMESIDFRVPSIICHALAYDPFKEISLDALNLRIIDLEYSISAYASHKVNRISCPKKLIEEIDSQPNPPPLTPKGKIKLNVTSTPSQAARQVAPGQSPAIKTLPTQTTSGQSMMLKVKSSIPPGTLQVVRTAEGLRTTIPLSSVNQTSTPGTSPTIVKTTLTPTATTSDGSILQRLPKTAGFAQLVHSSIGKHILLTSSPQNINNSQNQNISGATANTVLTAGGQILTVLPKQGGSMITLNKLQPSTPNKLVVRDTSQTASSPVTLVTPTSSPQRPILTFAQPSTKTLNPKLLAMAEALRQQKEPQQPKSVFYIAELEEQRKQERKDKLSLIAKINSRRCDARPLYGSDLISALKVTDYPSEHSNSFSHFPWNGGAGYIHCLKAQLPEKHDNLWTCTNTLRTVVHNPEQRINKLKDIISRFVMYIPSVNAPRLRLHASHANPSSVWAERCLEETISRELAPTANLLHPIVSGMATQFPDPRLIQYDCGKLQVMERLLRQLKDGGHRVLIFTQMTRMLDVLEAFLNHQGHIYLRLDGATRVDQRQLLMERFNADKRIFAFILSTRSGGIGVNLTGADTVIFYDSDWNPTMDAQAQDRCHRIGQTRDVHIYRLISEKTVEENILKKANQKRLLGDLAIEGGNFTTAYFKSSTIQDLFTVDESENDPTRRMAEVLESNANRDKQPSEEVPEENSALNNFESALAAAEDDTDVQAAKTARAEAAAELAEFDENVAIDDETGTKEQELDQSMSNMKEFQEIEDALSPIERYAVFLIEQTESESTAEQLAAADAEIEQQKKEWELSRLRALEEKQREDEEMEEEHLLEETGNNQITYSSRDSHSKIWLSTNKRDQMPMWCPPTPPQDDSDVYIDYNVSFLYECNAMPETQLPPVYVKRDRKRAISISSERDGRQPLKLRRADEVGMMHAPRSLFDRPTPAMIKLRRDIRAQKSRGGVLAMNRASSLLTMNTGLPNRPQVVARQSPVTPVTETTPEWSIYEDWALLQAIQNLQELTLNLIVISPGHTPNWDMVADMVNSVSRTYRSPKQCKNRYESHIIPREEGKVQYDTSPKKLKKQKGIYKTQTKGGRPMKTSQLYSQDNGVSFIHLYAERAEIVSTIVSKRTSPVFPRVPHPNPNFPTMNITNTNIAVPANANSNSNPPKHNHILIENNINYDEPLSPVSVAQKRQERIIKQKTQQQQLQQQLQAQQAAAAAAQQQQQQQQQQEQPTQSTAQTGQQQLTAATVKSIISTSPANVSSPIPAPAAAAQATASTAVVTSGAQTNALLLGIPPQSVGGQTSTIITTSAVTPQQLNATVVSMSGGTAVVQAHQNLSNPIRAQRTVTVQEMMAAVNRANPGTVTVAQRLGTSLVAAPSSAAVAKANVKGTIMAGKGHPVLLQKSQIQLLQKQKDIIKQQQQQVVATAGQIIASTVPNTTGTTQKMTVATPGNSNLALTTVQVQRSPQYIKQGIVAKQITRLPDGAAILKRTPLTQQGTVTTVTTGAGGQVQLQAQSLTPSSSPQIIPQTVQFKTAVAPKMTAAAAQQLRQLTLQVPQKKLPQQKGSKGAGQTQMIVQGQKSVPITMQQLLYKPSTGQVAGTSTPVLAHTVVVKGQGAGQTIQRVIPMTAAGLQKQTFQVVAAAPDQTITGRAGNLLTIDTSGRTPVSVTLPSNLTGNLKLASGSINTSQQTLINQVTAALQCQQAGQLTVRQGVPGQTVRISAPALTAVVQQQQQAQLNEQARQLTAIPVATVNTNLQQQTQQQQQQQQQRTQSDQ